MKKFTLISTLLTVVFMLTTIKTNAQDFPPLDKSPMDAAWFPSENYNADKKIKVIYSRPKLLGRPLEKFFTTGQVWRTGANEATEITFYSPVQIGDTKISPGTYSLFIIPFEEKWEVVINQDIHMWGTETYDPERDLLRFGVRVSSDDNSLEAFSIYFEELKNNTVNMHMGWDTKRVTVPISITQ